MKNRNFRRINERKLGLLQLAQCDIRRCFSTFREKRMGDPMVHSIHFFFLRLACNTLLEVSCAEVY